MNNVYRTIAIACATVAAAGAQDFDFDFQFRVPPHAAFQVAQSKEQAKELAAQAKEQAKQAKEQAKEGREQSPFGQQLAQQIAQQSRDLAEQIKNDVRVSFNGPFDFDINGDSYRSGQQALDGRRYEQAVTRFDRVIQNKAPRADGATYWKAYALSKLGRRDQALAALADLEKQFPQSRWLNDARALAVEVRASSGQAVSPETQADEDIKLMAINSLINQDPDRAIPLLEKVLADAKNPPNLKSRALYVLAHSKAPRAREIVMQYAKGGANPDLQLRAVEYVGTVRSPESLQALTDMYTATSDAAVKREIIRALGSQGAAKQLVDFARRETDLELKREIVRRLSGMKSKEATDYLTELLSK